MDASETSWLSDLLLQETDDCHLFRQCQLELFDEDDDCELLSHEIATAFENLQQQPLSFSSDTCYSETLMNSFSHQTSFESPINTNDSSWKSNSTSSPSSPTSKTVSFDNSTCFNGNVSVLGPKQNKKDGSVSAPQTRKRSSENPNFETESPKAQRSNRSPAHARDHIIAERKRREKLSRSLIALAALIPGLKKMDKVTVLGDAIKHVKELQERLRMLEEENRKREVECVMMVKKQDDDGSASVEDDKSDSDSSRERLPRVEARVSEKDVLLRIHCQKQKGILFKILVEIQNHNLFVINSSALPFGDSILHITIVAQMRTGYKLTTNDLVKSLRVATLK